MRLTNDMGKVKTICRVLMPVLVVVGMALSPFWAMETAEASSVGSAWVELSDGTALNSTSTALEYVIHFTTTTALSGGKDTITIFFPNGTTDRHQYPVNRFYFPHIVSQTSYTNRLSSLWPARG